jgi:catechol 2,3-dioxygenase-like lactoylglutathione lyase family enzyme
MELDTPMLFVATTDPERARKFYEEVLGLTFIADEPHALAFQVGELPLRIQKVESKPAVNHTVLGWMVADIRKAVEELSEAGVTFALFDGLKQDADGIWQSPGGAKVAWFRDPDDNMLSLTEYPA